MFPLRRTELNRKNVRRNTLLPVTAGEMELGLHHPGREGGGWLGDQEVVKLPSLPVELNPGDLNFFYIAFFDHLPDNINFLADNHGEITAKQGVDRSVGKQRRALVYLGDDTSKDEDI